MRWTMLLAVVLIGTILGGAALGQTTPGPKLLALRQAQATPPPVSVGAGAALIVAGKDVPVAITFGGLVTRAPSWPIKAEALGTSQWEYGGAVVFRISDPADKFSQATHIVWSAGFEKALQACWTGPAALTHSLNKWSDVSWGWMFQWDAVSLNF